MKNIDCLKDHVVDITTHFCVSGKAQELCMKVEDPIKLKWK